MWAPGESGQGVMGVASHLPLTHVVEHLITPARKLGPVRRLDEPHLHVSYLNEGVGANQSGTFP